MSAKVILRSFVAGLVGVLVYVKFGRQHVVNWGATREETKRSMPGDDILQSAALQTTRAITIAAPPSAIWPWLVQMGPRPRAGAYTYDWIERLLGIDIENSDEILPQFQHLSTGEFLSLNTKGQGIRVVSLDPERYLVLQWEPAKSTWAFALYADGGVTRLVSRNRLPNAGPLFWPAAVLFMEPGSLVMERKMLLGIKTRAERLARTAGQTG